MGISITQLLIVLAIVILLFGTKKLRNIGGDLGGAIKTFKKSMKDEDDGKKTDDGDPEKLTEQKSERVIESEASSDTTNSKVKKEEKKA